MSLAMVILLLATLSSACISIDPGPPSSQTVSVDASYNGRTVEVSLGGSLKVALEANPSTGYQWRVTEIGDGQVLAEAGREFKPRDAAPGLVGVGGMETWTFRAVGRGDAQLRMAYFPPGRDQREPARTFGLRVIVE
jgi:inhibitor of cysteine peptidase